VLKKIEFMYDSNAPDEQMRSEIKKLTRAHGILIEPRSVYDRNTNTSTVSTLKQDERKEHVENDNISHFICRLAYCRNEELRKWYVTQETRLFNIRLGEVQPGSIK
jgi:DNA primase large subunit